MFCWNCGQKLRDDALFCPNCGAKVKRKDGLQGEGKREPEGKGKPSEPAVRTEKPKPAEETGKRQPAAVTENPKGQTETGTGESAPMAEKPGTVPPVGKTKESVIESETPVSSEGSGTPEPMEADRESEPILESRKPEPGTEPDQAESDEKIRESQEQISKPPEYTAVPGRRKSETEAGEPKPVSDGGRKGKKRTGKPVALIVAAVVIVVLLLGGAVYGTVGLDMQKESELDKLEDCGFAEYEKQAEREADDWEDLGILDIGKKREIIENLKSVREELDDFIQDQIDAYEDVDLSGAEESEVLAYETQMDDLEELTEGGTWDYAAIKKVFEEVDKIVFMYIEPEHELLIQVQQVDATEFPKIRLYVNVKDPASGEVPEDLDGALFYVRKEDANAEFIRQTLTNANQLNEMEALKVNMVADVSGSMNGSPLQEAKSIMNNFIGSMQFDAGDQVELTSFSTGVRLEQEFCDDAGILTQKVNQLTTDDMTSLYDALYTAVERVAGQTGARCVIAFTDGNDNYSSCSQEDVVQVAKRYHVPVFIIGIGSIDFSQIRYITSQTGGMYYSIDDIDSMESIYEEIYEMEKELYLLEFVDSTGSAADDLVNLQVGYHSQEYGGTCAYSYQPNILLSAKNAGIYKDGPEAVVEQYLKNFPQAVSNNDFSLIEAYMKPGSDIYNEQEKYVQRDISERLDTYELIRTDYSDANHCVISTRETYYVQVQGKALQLMTQECEYALEKSGDKWEMTAFVDLKVVSRIKQ